MLCDYILGVRLTSLVGRESVLPPYPASSWLSSVGDPKEDTVDSGDATADDLSDDTA